MKISLLFILLLSLWMPAYAGSTYIQMYIMCKVSRGANIVKFQPTTTMSKIDTKSNYIGEYSIGCPKGSTASVTYEINAYEMKNNKLCEIEKPAEAKPQIYQDPDCKELWHEGSIQKYVYCGDKICYTRALYCSTKVKAENKNYFYVMDITINY